MMMNTFPDSGREHSSAAALVLTILLTVVFFGAGLSKLIAAPKLAESFGGWGLPAWTMFVVGGLEVVGALGLWVPRVQGLAALGLVALMIGAIVTHLRVGEIPYALVPLLLSGLTAVLAWMRLGEERAERRARANATGRA